MISYKCRKCGFAFSFSDKSAGKRAKCRNCDSVFTIPGGEPDPVQPTLVQPPQPQVIYAAPPAPRYQRSNPSQISNGVAAILSFLIPGLGQMCQNRAMLGLLSLIMTFFGYLLFIIPGLVLHLVVIVDAAMWKEPTR